MPERTPVRRFSMTERNCTRVTTQVDKVARDGYRLNDAGSAFWAGRDRATTLVAGAGHVEPLGWFCVPQGACQLSFQRNQQLASRSDRSQARSLCARCLSSARTKTQTSQAEIGWCADFVAAAFNRAGGYKVWRGMD